MIVDEIKRQLDKHLDLWGISIDTLQYESIIDSVLIGESAFNLIYDENYKIISYTKLNREKLKFNGLYSYDGDRFQWSEIETLIFNISIIREIKIDQILKQKI